MKAWFGVGLILAGELLMVWSFPEQARTVARVTYQTLWQYAPKPAGYQPPDRFATPR